MARTKQVARWVGSADPKAAVKGSASMRMSPYVKKSESSEAEKAEKREKREKRKKMKAEKEAKEGKEDKGKGSEEESIREPCKSEAECKCWYSCFAPPSSPWEEGSYSEDSSSDSEDDEDAEDSEDAEDAKDGDAKTNA